jgi:endonuclease/exonuclease/phosphatase (EEP) superfamily protein YafD
VVIAGDFNSEEIGVHLRREGYRWVTEGIGPTVSFFSWDHIFARGMRVAGAGVVREIHGASDHRPVWAVVTPVLAERASPPALTAAGSR